MNETTRCGPVEGVRCAPVAPQTPEGTIHINRFPGSPRSNRVAVFFQGDAFAGKTPSAIRFPERPHPIPLYARTAPGGGPKGAQGGRRYFTGTVNSEWFPKEGSYPAQVKVADAWLDVSLKVTMSH